MVDSCTITTDPEGHGDDTWDDNLGDYVFPVGDETVVYTGKCMIYEDSSPLTDENGGLSQAFLRYWCEVPITVLGLKENDIVTVDDSQDDELLDKKFLVRAVVDDTYGTSRRIRMSRRASRPRS